MLFKKNKPKEFNAQRPFSYLRKNTKSRLRLPLNHYKLELSKNIKALCTGCGFGWQKLPKEKLCTRCHNPVVELPESLLPWKLHAPNNNPYSRGINAFMCNKCAQRYYAWFMFGAMCNHKKTHHPPKSFVCRFCCIKTAPQEELPLPPPDAVAQDLPAYADALAFLNEATQTAGRIWGGEQRRVYTTRNVATRDIATGRLGMVEVAPALERERFRREFLYYTAPPPDVAPANPTGVEPPIPPLPFRETPLPEDDEDVPF